MRNYISQVCLLMFFFLGLNVFAQQINNSSLIERIKSESEWNTVNYFDEIDKVLASKSSDEDKVVLLLYKAQYFSNVKKFDDALKTIQLAEKRAKRTSFEDSVTTLIQLRKSSYYANLNKYFEAYREWLKCNNYYLLNKNYDGLAYTQQVLALIYLHLDQKENARKALIKAKKYAFVNNNPKILKDHYRGVSNYWGIIGNFDSCLYYLRYSENIGPLNKIDLNSDFNKGVIYLQMGDIDNSRLYFQKTINDSYKVNCKAFAGVGKYGMGLTYLNDNKTLAFQYFKESLWLIDQYNPDLEINICECILENFSGKEYEALRPFFENRKQHYTLKKEHLDKIQVGKLFNMSSYMNEQLMQTQRKLEHKQLEETRHKQRFFIVLLFSIVIIIILILVLYAYRVVVLSRKTMRQQNIQEKIVMNSSIVTITNYNAMMLGLTKKLKQIALGQTSKKLSDELYELSNNINEKALGAKSKELKDLDLVIQSINDGFIKKLCTKFPALTSGEITLAIYLRMNFTTKQIAELKGASENSIDVARSRLRSKIGIKGENTDLSTYLNKI